MAVPTDLADGLHQSVCLCQAVMAVPTDLPDGLGESVCQSGSLGSKWLLMGFTNHGGGFIPP
eukprot:1706449-Karenia_brevis.AAC.1